VVWGPTFEGIVPGIVLFWSWQRWFNQLVPGVSKSKKHELLESHVLYTF